MEAKNKTYKSVNIEFDNIGENSLLRNLILRHNIIVETLSQGDNIHGLEINTSTASYTSGNTGHNFMKLCRLSK